MKPGLALFLPLLSLLLSACAGQVAREPGPQSWEQHRASLQQLSQWTAAGKLALRTPERAESASILWQQQGLNTHLQLSGPMGLNATTIRSDGYKMEMRQGEIIKTWDISSPGAISRSTGWDLPLHALPYWLKGLPSPDSAIQLLELVPNRAVLHRLRQDDWEVLYEDYGQFEDFTLPTHLRIQRGATSARMIIRDWQTPSA